VTVAHGHGLIIANAIKQMFAPVEKLAGFLQQQNSGFVLAAPTFRGYSTNMNNNCSWLLKNEF
jgi:hypothetical protein